VQGCQIFPRTIYQNSKIYSTKLPQNIPQFR
jgi:hypothetical protein